MENKKSKQANLENKKGVFIQIGLVVALAIVLISFEWTSTPQLMDDISMVNVIDFDDDIVLIPRPVPPKEEVKPKAPEVIEVIEIVEDDAEADVYDIDMEVGPDTRYDIFHPEIGDEIIPEPEIFIVVEEMPRFNGGDAKVEFRKYIAKNMKYPEIPAANGVSGRVLIQFTVNSEGDIIDAHITRSVDPELDKEALRVVESSPKWTPGKQRGKAVNVLYSFPITFVLQ